MFNDRNDELNKLLDLYEKTMNLVVKKLDEDEYKKCPRRKTFA
ncbi:hypothetical protein GCM10007358_17490 [Phocicoccus schoeneichii]|nr:hypothetical protein GCM10007358_17490 [Jeotgalicoccus schoeneichii]